MFIDLTKINAIIISIINIITAIISPAIATRLFCELIPIAEKTIARIVSKRQFGERSANKPSKLKKNPIIANASLFVSTFLVVRVAE